MSCNKLTIATLCSALFLYSCSQGTGIKNRGPIVLGDSSMIVTEKDPKLLTNAIPDYTPIKIQEVVRDTVKAAPVDSVAKNVVAKPGQEDSEGKKNEQVKPSLAIKGLQVPFKNLNMILEGVEGKAGKKLNWETAHAAAFTLNNGSLDGKALVIDGKAVNKVQQRIQTAVLLTFNGKEYELTALGEDRGDWTVLQGKNGKYALSGLSQKQLRFDVALSNQKIKLAVQKLARQQKWRKKDEQKALESVARIKTAGQAPLSIAVTSVTWKVNAKDQVGKLVDRELRLDIPVE